MGRPIESFEDWKARQSAAFASERTALVMYLTDQIKLETASLRDFAFKHPVIGLLAHLGERDNRAQELLTAYLALTVMDDEAPARALIAGKRLNQHLHPEYVARTQCYGQDGDRSGRLGPVTFV